MEDPNPQAALAELSVARQQFERAGQFAEAAELVMREIVLLMRMRGRPSRKELARSLWRLAKYGERTSPEHHRRCL